MVFEGLGDDGNVEVDDAEHMEALEDEDISMR